MLLTKINNNMREIIYCIPEHFFLLLMLPCLLLSQKAFYHPLLVGSTLYRKYGSKKILQICYSLGFSCSYSEVKLYQICASKWKENYQILLYKLLVTIVTSMLTH